MSHNKMLPTSSHRSPAYRAGGDLHRTPAR